MLCAACSKLKVRMWLAVFIPLASLFVSCQEGGDAGDLWGQWRQTDSDEQYISFSGHLVLFRHLTQGEVFGKAQQVGDSLFIQCVSIYSLPKDTAMIEQTYGFKPFTDIRLRVNTLNGDRLVLSKDGRTWTFRKY